MVIGNSKQVKKRNGKVTDKSIVSIIAVSGYQTIRSRGLRSPVTIHRLSAL